MTIKFHEHDYYNSFSRMRPSTEVRDVYEMDGGLIPREGEFVQRNYKIFKIESVLYSIDTDEIIISLRPIKDYKTQL